MCDESFFDHEGLARYCDILGSLLQARYSCRGFLPDPVPRPVIERILGLAQRTASWCNAQPWQVVIASETATTRLREELIEHIRIVRPKPDFAWPSAYHGVYQERRRECGLQLYKSVGVDRGDIQATEQQRLENFRFFGAPHVAIITTDRELGTYGAIDCGAYVANFVLAARSLGVGAIAQAALAAYPTFWRERLRLGEERLVVCGISLGHEDPMHPANRFRTSRADVSQAARWVEE
jgi:nitroreductase